jgi:large subunit ribosomal protein L3
VWSQKLTNMSLGILGKKIGMTQIFRENGLRIPVTVIEAGPCFILQVKKNQTDGYCAIQFGFDEKKELRTKKPDLNRFKKVSVTPKRFIREIRTTENENYQLGQRITVEIFNVGDYVDVTGISIGKGFQGGMKRWHWKGGPKTHGSTSHRRPGSIGSSSDPSRVFKGHHLPGHMGQDKVTVQNLEVIKVDRENNLLAVKGAVPGHRNSYLIIKKAKKKQIKR